MHTDLKYKNGALNVTKEGMYKFTHEHGDAPRLSHHSKNIKKKEKVVHSYDYIKQQQQRGNDEFGTGKKYKRVKGHNAKLNRGGKKRR